MPAAASRLMSPSKSCRRHRRRSRSRAGQAERTIQERGHLSARHRVRRAEARRGATAGDALAVEPGDLVLEAVDIGERVRRQEGQLEPVLTLECGGIGADEPAAFAARVSCTTPAELACGVARRVKKWKPFVSVIWMVMSA